VGLLDEDRDLSPGEQSTVPTDLVDYLIEHACAVRV